MLFVYAGFLLSSLTGRLFIYGKPVLQRIPLGVLLASVGFFLISNIGNWLAFYPLSMEGLLACYVSGIPYFGRTLIGNVMYGILFFGSFEGFKYWLKNRHAITMV